MTVAALCLLQIKEPALQGGFLLVERLCFDAQGFAMLPGMFVSGQTNFQH